ncbi:PEGA domain-containing protein [Spirochaeta isovalerica]|nr:PEGA domain-containing protein [Spirochaeta isovalerica]
MAKRLLIIILICIGQGLLFVELSAIIQEEKVTVLHSHLSEVSFEQNSDSLLNITGRLTLIKNRLDAGDSPMDNYQYEARMQSLTSGLNLYGDQGNEEELRRSTPLTKAVRYLLGSNESRLSAEDPEYFPHLEEAYYWERNRHYDLAVEKYRFLVSRYSRDLKSSVMDTILLHLSFSHLMNAEYSEAERIADEIISRSENIVFRITADRINTFLFSLRKKQQQLAQLEENSLELGREQYFSVKYREAIATLAIFLEESDPSLKEEAEARYYLARAMEELGNTEDSINEYQRILALSDDENITMEAGRRLLMIDSFYDISDEETETLAKTLEGYEDPELNELIAPFRELYIEPAVSPTASASLIAEGEETEGEAEPQRTGEIYLTTTPPGAAVSINGISFGISPLFITSLPVGDVIVKAEYEDRMIERSIEVTDRIIRKVNIDIPNLPVDKASAEVKIPKGTFIVSYDLKEVSMELNYEPVDYASGAPVSLDPGEYIFIISGRDELDKLYFWEGVITVEEEKTTKISIPD